MTYHLLLTEDDVDTIAFVGDRYAWSDALRALDVGDNEVPEPEAWRIKEAFESDMEGGHSPFPMLDEHSELHGKLVAFWDRII